MSALPRTTIRTTIQSLIHKGLVEIRCGNGTLVTSPIIVQELLTPPPGPNMEPHHNRQAARCCGEGLGGVDLFVEARKGIAAAVAGRLA